MTELKHILPGEPIPRGSLFHERRYRVAMKLADSLAPAGFLLDIGCGNGSQTEFFAQHFRRTMGIDLQYDRLAGFQKDSEEHNGLKISLLGATAERLPFGDCAFGCVSCFEVLEHVPDQRKTLAEILRVLAPGGVAIMTVPHRWWIFETHGASLPILPWNRVPFFSWLPKQIHDTWARARNYRRKEIIELLREAGFVDIRAVLLTAPMDVIKIKILQKILRSVIFVGDVARIPFLSSNIFVYAKKNT